MHSFQCHVGSMRSPSKGFVKLRSPSPYDKPRLLFNYMAHDTDWREFRAAVRLTREIISQRALEEFRGVEIQPGKKYRQIKRLISLLDHMLKQHYILAALARWVATMTQWQWWIIRGAYTA